MFFISAQPDNYYFLWQLQLQMFNFREMGIKSEDIHILIGYKKKRGLSLEFRNLMEQNPKIKIFAYEDTRKRRRYLSSLRPHLIAKHFKTFPELQKQVFFYHDSDVVFSKLPNFSLMNTNDIWYTSNTRSYLDTNYIKKTGGEKLFKKMCAIVGIDEQDVIVNDANAGGAQYLLKHTDYSFWEKVERDCEKLYKLLFSFNGKLVNQKNQTRTIDPWVTDMWVVWWNAIILKKEFKIHSELDFCWANSPIQEWETKKILHYTGHVDLDNKKLFRKNNYSYYPPFFDDFTSIANNTCSYSLIKLMRAYNKEQDEYRTNLLDVTFIYIINKCDIQEMENIYANINYLTKNFKTNILLIEIDFTPKIDKLRIHDDIKYIYIRANGIKYCKQNIFPQPITEYVVFYDIATIIPVEQIMNSILLLKSRQADIVIPRIDLVYRIDILLKAVFIKLLDDNLLETNLNKLKKVEKPTLGSLFTNLELFKKIGFKTCYLYILKSENGRKVLKDLIKSNYKMKNIEGFSYQLDS